MNDLLKVIHFATGYEVRPTLNEARPGPSYFDGIKEGPSLNVVSCFLSGKPLPPPPSLAVLISVAVLSGVGVLLGRFGVGLGFEHLLDALHSENRQLIEQHGWERHGDHAEGIGR